MMCRMFIELYRNRRGVTAVEFAILALPLFMLAFGTLEFGRALWVREGLEMSAIEGARCIGILESSCASSGSYSSANATTYIENLAGGWGITLTSANLTLTNNSTNSWCSGLTEVTITYTFQSPVAALISALSNGLSLSGHACFPNG